MYGTTQYIFGTLKPLEAWWSDTFDHDALDRGRNITPNDAVAQTLQQMLDLPGGWREYKGTE